MIEAHKTLRWPLALLVAALFAGCTTPPQKPPQPKAITSQSRGRVGPPGAMPDGSTINGQGGPGAPGTGQGYGATSAHAAEVEEEEVAADGSTRLISSSRRATPPSGAAGQPASGGSGGAPLPASSSAAQSGDGGSAVPPPPATSPPAAMEGAHFDVPEDAAHPSGDTLNASPASGARDGRPDAELNGRHGVRAGRDESGATRGTPSVPSSRQREVGKMPPRENDILAQQLREAAEKEKDSVLREKLWAAYRKYKAGL